MAERGALPDYATMRRSIERIHEGDALAGLGCPHAECDGTARREDDGLVCEDCSREVRLG